LSCEGESGSARNSKKLRETFTASATLPLFSTSGASRTSTTSVLPCAIISLACAGVIRGTAALWAFISSFKFVVTCLLPCVSLMRQFDVPACLTGLSKPTAVIECRRFQHGRRLCCASVARKGGAMQKTYDALVKLALFCANQARTNTMKDAAREAWRLAVEYRDQAAKLGEPPDIGKKPPQIDEA
jgi:hypothetical protein